MECARACTLHVASPAHKTPRRPTPGGPAPPTIARSGACAPRFAFPLAVCAREAKPKHIGGPGRRGDMLDGQLHPACTLVADGTGCIFEGIHGMHEASQHNREGCVCVLIKCASKLRIKHSSGKRCIEWVSTAIKGL